MSDRKVSLGNGSVLPQTVRRVTYVLLVWAEPRESGAPAWRGALLLPGDERWYFHTLAGLNSLLRELAGWRDPEREP